MNRRICVWLQLSRLVRPSHGLSFQSALSPDSFLSSPRADLFVTTSTSGASFEVLCLGRWWASLDRDMWPPGQEAAVTEDFEVNCRSV